MKLSVIGLGQCGCNIADAFFKINTYAQSFFHRRIEILTDAFAINTDEADLGGFGNIPKDRQHRILIGNMSGFGHGVGKINTDAFGIIKNSHQIVMDTILSSRKFHEGDAILVVAGGGGGSGSGFIGYLVKTLKEKVDKPVYAIVVLPFLFEEGGDVSYAVINTATCIKTVDRYADGLILIDNERYRKTGLDMRQTYQKINEEIAGTFFDLCCAGEERNTKYLGSKIIDAGDIRQSIDGLTAIGRGEVALPSFRWTQSQYKGVIVDQSSTFGALKAAVSGASVNFQFGDARKILMLASAPKGVISTSIMEEMSNWLNSKAPKAIVRLGDYPRRSSEIVVSMISSRLTSVPRLEEIYVRAEKQIANKIEIDRGTVEKITLMSALSRALPTLD